MSQRQDNEVNFNQLQFAMDLIDNIGAGVELCATFTRPQYRLNYLSPSNLLSSTGLLVPVEMST